MATFELTKKNDVGGIPKGFKLIVKSEKNFGWPEKEEYLTSLEYLPNLGQLKLRGDWNALTGSNWNGHWSVTNTKR
ncbi:MAG: hypothetical protein J5711_04385 [Bacteroidales bacterium]|nr:hypothetical protein [Bacteroidales bacterium]